jgi:hypothetical protein
VNHPLVRRKFLATFLFSSSSSSSPLPPSRVRPMGGRGKCGGVVADCRSTRFSPPPLRLLLLQEYLTYLPRKTGPFLSSFFPPSVSSVNPRSSHLVFPLLSSLAYAFLPPPPRRRPVFPSFCHLSLRLLHYLFFPPPYLFFLFLRPRFISL